ncbi:MAG: sodium:solute symporter family protein [Blastocatellia bacterium]|nr:sodium:solute symporter family protein [Blastocatellia bacterium]
MTYLLILIAYAVLMVAFGVFFSRRVTQSSDFFVAGRGLGAGLIFSTLLAANIGAGSTVGATGLGYRIGLSAIWWVGSAGLGSLLLAFTVGPRIWRVAKENDLYTVGDYLEFRFSRAVRGLVAVLLWLGSLAILAGQLIAIGLILHAVTGISKAAGCLIGAGVTILYFASGGLQGAARVNALQLIIKLLGFGMALGFLLDRSGGWRGMREAVAANPGVADAAAYLDPTGIGAPGVLRYIALLAPSFVISPGLLQKIFGARDERAVRKGVALNALCLLGFAIVPALLGIFARNQFPTLTNPEAAMPMLLTQSLPLWLGGLLLGAIFAAEVSTADAVLFMLSTSLSKDLYQTYLRPEADDAQLMRVVRRIAVVCGLLGAALGIVFETVIGALTIFYTLLSAALLLPLLAGLYTKRVGSRAAMAAMLVSVGATFALDRLTVGQGKWGLPSLLLGALAGLLVMIGMSLRPPVPSTPN